ncbi:MAG: LytTR family DNA-binding domain-containing protein [Pseudomonadota bacterium]
MKVLIADDERLARERLLRLLAALPEVEVVGEAESGRALHALLPVSGAEVVLLDIDMPGERPGEDGVALGAWLASLPQPPAVIYVTAHPEHALRAFATHAVDYVLKPVSLERLRAALAAAGRVNRVQAAQIIDAVGDSAQQAKSAARQLTVKQGRSLRVLAVDDVLCFEAGEGYVTACLADGSEAVLDESLAALEARFADFVRVHRAILVARGRIERLELGADGVHRLYLRGRAQAVEVSRRQLKVVKEVMGLAAA